METTVPWSELVTAALLGAERRTPPGGSVTALLDAAAVETVRRRAGMLPTTAGPRPDPAPEDHRAPLPRAAAHRLTLLLANRWGTGGSGGRRGATPDLAELLPQWLAAANERGYRVPDAQLPDLLDAARARTDLRPQARTFAGPRGLWLARQNPEWKFVLRGTPGSDAGTGAEAGADAVPDGAVGPAGIPPGAGPDDEAVHRLWDEGLFSERVALLTAVRQRDPAAGLTLLARSWSKERAEDRLMFLDSLRGGLSPEDEPFLESALGDRSRTVRATAAELLSSLPGSALAARMAERARSCVGVDPTGGGAARSGAERVVVEAPHECDAAMQRDGVTPKPPAGRGERAWWLVQLVEATPLSTWPERFGDRTPAEITALPVADGWRQDLHAAWCLAAVRQRDPEWARALVGAPGAPLADGPGDPAKLLAVLPAAERADWAARFIAAHGLSEAFRILGVCALPWTAALGRAVVDALEIARDAGSYPWSFSGVMGLAERCLDPADADRLAPLAAVPDEPEDGAPGAGSYWSEAFQRLVSTLRLRAEMLAELRGEEVPASGG
ncbi:DUF5691 domain-containing protein [Streptomyces phytohabitans]|uniref:DUF5691 domain-containing protein n=1 Tax=Streptomyces phytohabitans TaxID=1150371 RepID=UPI00345C301D